LLIFQKALAMLYETLEDPEVQHNKQLRMEFGWTGVAGGLTHVLVGYATMIVGIAVGVGFVILAFHNGMDGMLKRGAKPSMGSIWMLYIGLGVLSLVGLLSYGFIIGGQFKCMFYASERHGARWFMLLCIACMVLGPACQVGSIIASWQVLKEARGNPAKLQEFQQVGPGRWMQLTAFGVSMLYPFCFCLFLRAVAVCLRAYKHATAINVFLGLGAALAVGTGYVLFQHPHGGGPTPVALMLAINGSWAVLGIVYIGLIAAMRICIGTVMGRVRSPLEFQH
jgi:hypothetical protein